MTNRKSITAGIRMLAIATVAFPASMLFADDADAQKFFSQQQIVNQLHVQQGNNNGSNGSRRALKRVMQPEGQGQFVAEEFNPNIKAKRRTPQFENNGQFNNNNGGHVVMKRVPMPENQDANGGSVLADGGNMKTFRAPQAEDNGGRIVQEMRVPGPVNGNGNSNGNGTAQFRAPGPKNNDVIVASNGNNGGNNDVEVRGIDVRKKVKVEQHVAVGQQVASNEEFDAGAVGSGRIDLEILFDYDSDRINPNSVKQLIALAEALNDPALGKGRFVIAGHTDAAGSREYNNDLSRRRAAAVTEFLVYYAGIDARRLIPEGYGEELLKYPDAPESGQNRRVEIINMGDAG